MIITIKKQPKIVQKSKKSEERERKRERKREREERKINLANTRFSSCFFPLCESVSERENHFVVFFRR